MKSTNVLTGVFCLVYVMMPWTFAIAGEPQTRKDVGKKPELAAVLRDIQKANTRLNERFPNRLSLLDQDRRDEILKYGLPEAKQLVAAYEEIRKLNPKAEKHTIAELSFLTILASWGDVQAKASLEKLAKEEDSSLAVAATAGRLVSQWMQFRHAPDQQAKVLEEMHGLATTHAEEDMLVPFVMMMCQHGAASSGLCDAAVGIVINDLQGPKAKQIARKLANYTQMRKLVGKPLVLSGTTYEGTSFSTATWKDKVIVVNFWATWCSACRAELPRLKAIYAKYHDKGLEVLGISCDKNIETLRAYLAQEQGMSWPQLCDFTKTDWHILAQQCNVRGLPTVFLIDKAGVVRSVTARDDGEKLIVQLLNEPTSIIRNGKVPQNSRKQQSQATGTEIIEMAGTN